MREKLEWWLPAAGGRRKRPGSEMDSRSSEVPAAAERSATPAAQKRLSEERTPQQEEPAAKRQARDHEDGPLALVMPKVREPGWTCLVMSR